jgi:hypothetical protein
VQSWSTTLVGVDPDRDCVTVAVLDGRPAGVVSEGRFSASGDGYDEAVTFVDGHIVETSGRDPPLVLNDDAPRGTSCIAPPSP